MVNLNQSVSRRLIDLLIVCTYCWHTSTLTVICVMYEPIGYFVFYWSIFMTLYDGS